MIYDAIEAVATIVTANFFTDMAALISAKGLTGLTTTAAIEKRQRAELYVALGAALPAIGIYGLMATTQAKWQGKRDASCTLGLDYYATGTDPIKLAQQTELAAEALLRSIDRIWPTAAGGAGEGFNSVSVELSAAYMETDKPEGQTVTNYGHRAMLTFTVVDRDEGL